MTGHILSDYERFIKNKQAADIPSGFDLDVPTGPLFDFQAACVKWALKRGRAALFADTGLGKTAMQTTWAQAVAEHTGGNVIIAAPLCVAQQTVEEAAKFGITVKYCRADEQVEPGITITNYEMLEHFDLESFAGVVLDESSILKSHTSKTREAITKAFKRTPYKLSCTATPSPNDYIELGNQAEFLGVMSAQEMLATFFTHDGGDTSKWRLKGHGKVRFWEWMATWAICIRNPSDLGFDGARYELPPVNLIEHTVSGGDLLEGQLFAVTAQTLSERRQAKKSSMSDRVALAYDIVSVQFRDKLADSTIKKAANVEAGICSETKGKISDRSEGAREENGAICDGPSGAQGIPAPICEGESREVSENAGTASQSQRGAQEDIRGKSSGARAIEGEGKGIPSSQSREAAGGRSEHLRADTGNVCENDERSGAQVRDLRILGDGAEEDVPDDRSLPQYGSGKGHSVLELQHGAREVQGQHIPAGNRNIVSEKEPWLIWCHLNDEQDALVKLFGDKCFSVQGSNTIAEKESAISGWLRGDRPVMISKPSIMGFGLNFQHCANMIFAGMDDSFEKYYQAVRRSHRFGQKRQVDVHIITAETEGAVKANIQRKQAQSDLMAEQMVAHMRSITRRSIAGATSNTETYNPTVPMTIPAWIIANIEN